MRVVRLTEKDLGGVGVSVVTWRPSLILQCDVCSHTWPAVKRHGAYLTRDYWHCPRQCNLEPGGFAPEVEPVYEQIENTLEDES